MITRIRYCFLDQDLVQDLVNGPASSEQAAELAAAYATRLAAVRRRYPNAQVVVEHGPAGTPAREPPSGIPRNPPVLAVGRTSRELVLALDPDDPHRGYRGGHR